jgi:nucleoporin p58/p45
VEGYEKNMKEIEEHLRIVEGNAVARAKEIMAAKGRDAARDRDGAGASRKEDNLRELAGVLMEFENGILHVAGNVGASREKVQELMLSRMGRWG